ncbi:MAG: phospho-sugar mutase, partial [Candidatus Latescibacteria bacterium]|nr:phospho-sugar mutase [Candidatus Latescibacterota bacterium]
MTIHQQVKNWAAENKISAAAFQGLSQWLIEPEFADFVPEIQLLIENEDIDELEDAFRTHIEFGTGGIRGKMGPGPNRINLRTIGEAAQGLAQYILKSGIEDVRDKGVVIAYDTRNNSDVFARETASIIAGNGIVARLFDGPRATPHLSFALRQTGAVAGVVISASHNPPSDNGFKAYWIDGGQVVPPHDKNIIAEVGAVKRLNSVDYEEGVERGLIEVLDAKLDVQYVESLADLSLCDARDISVVYTPLHGVGATSVVPALRKLGYSPHLVEAQDVPDGNFPTVAGGVANPEDPGALSLSVEDAKRIRADIVLASDPDADRLGCALSHPQKGWDAALEDLAINGNQIGAILCYYILTSLKEQDKLPDRGVVCKTIVTTDLISLIARDFGLIPVDNLLVGFKYIGDVINNLSDDETFVFGTEESHGYLFTDFVRDKDAAVAAVLLAEC